VTFFVPFWCQINRLHYLVATTKSFIRLLKLAPFGNAAHISGILFGAILAGTFVLSYKRVFFRAALAILLVLSFVPLFYCPWSISWWSHATYKEHVAGRYDVALAGYSYIIEQSPDNAWAYESRSMVNESLGNREQAEADFQRACELDPSIRGKIRE
jgi:GlpG protein